MFSTSKTLTITYNLGDGWPVRTDTVLDLISYLSISSGRQLVSKWTCNTPSDGINLCKENPPLFYASPVPGRVRETSCKKGSTWGKIGSLRLTKVRDPGK